ncbi:MAG: hypothetical protein AUH71_03385 [Thaumarchaeota archaeon 13_1_40CM_4_48_7]|nr:MAG: hypothetical protein AUH71_03385 [Thaumarchaeota archaeon 13_1_40CM_4_48_7]
MGAVYAIPNQRAFAHTFSGDESASFLATVEVIKVHLDLAKKDFTTNATLSAEHVEHAGEHLTNDTIKEITERNKRLGTDLPASLKDLREALEGGNATAVDVNGQVTNINSLLDETVTVRIEKTQLTNSTVQGTMLADFADEILESYDGAYANQTNIVNMMDYESAQALAVRAQELFDSKLKAMAEANATAAVTALDAGLKKLKQAIDDKAAPDNVDSIVNKDVHPNIQKAFNLQIIPEFPLPLVLTIPAIAGIIIAAKINTLRKR